MRIGIDAANLRGGGGVTHLAELLAAGDPRDCGIDRVTVWSGRQTLAELSPRPWLDLRTDRALDQGLLQRTRWQTQLLSGDAGRTCDVLFVPGGSYYGTFRPFVTMFRNMLPFAAGERQRYGASGMRLKLEILRRTQRWTFRRASGLILLTDHARSVLQPELAGRAVATAVIPHGVDRSLLTLPRPQQPLHAYSTARPFQLLYVSTVDAYKHQWRVAEAVAALRGEGLPVAVTFVGGAYPPALRRLDTTLASLPGAAAFVTCAGAVPRSALGGFYRAADAFVFASTCENLPNTLIEAMAAGLPVAASNRRPMPDVLGPEGLYFDADSTDATTAALRRLVQDAALRARIGAAAYARAQAYSWERCARETFGFIRSVGVASRAAAAETVGVHA